MKGVVDDSGRAILPIKILCPKYPTGLQIDTWIDTGSIDGVLADGSGIELSTYHCELEWFGKLRALEVIANSGQTPLLGVGLLLAKELRVDYSNLELTLTLKPKRAGL
jgi:hypothetical protein